MKLTKSIALSAFILIFSMVSLGVVADKAYEQGVLGTKTMIPKPIIKTVYKEKVVYKNPKGIIASVSMIDLNNDMKNTYKFVSKTSRITILEAIAKTSDKYKINPLILYAIIDVESDFQAWKTHTPKKINKNTSCIGLGGISPYYWVKPLIKADIIETKYDLYNPTTNVLAIGFIMAGYKKEPLLKGVTDKTTSALRRYFGDNYKSYSDKIEKVVGRILFAKVYD